MFIICFIISCGFGWSVAVAGWVALTPDAVAGEVAGVCANDGFAISIANSMAANDVIVFIVRIVPVTRLRVKLRRGRRYNASGAAAQSSFDKGTRIKIGPNLSNFPVVNAKELTKWHYYS